MELLKIVGFGALGIVVLGWLAVSFLAPSRQRSILEWIATSAAFIALLTFFINSTVALSKSWLITGEALTESQTSNVNTSEYDNTAVSMAIIYIF